MQTNPFENPELHDSFVIFTRSGRITFPGLNVLSVSGGLRVDSKDIAGGATSQTSLGFEPHTVTLKNTVWTESQYNKLGALVALMRPQKNTEPEEFEATHPLLELRKIQKLFIVSIESPEYNRREGWVTLFKMQEWFPDGEKVPTKHMGGPGSEGIGAVDGNFSIVDEFAANTPTPTLEPDAPSLEDDQ
jgi:hypothetical protein